MSLYVVSNASLTFLWAFFSFSSGTDSNSDARKCYGVYISIYSKASYFISPLLTSSSLHLPSLPPRQKGIRRHRPSKVRLHLSQRPRQQHHPPPQRPRQSLPPLLLLPSFRQFLPPFLLFFLLRHRQVHVLHLPLLPAGISFLPPSFARTAHQRVLPAF